MAPRVLRRAKISTPGNTTTVLEVQESRIRLFQARNCVYLSREELVRVVDEVLATPTGVSPAKAQFANK